VFEKSLDDSASAALILRTLISFFLAPSLNIDSMSLNLLPEPPIMIRDGLRLSFNALPSLRNSAQNKFHLFDIFNHFISETNRNS